MWRIQVSTQGAAAPALASKRPVELSSAPRDKHFRSVMRPHHYQQRIKYLLPERGEPQRTRSLLILAYSRAADVARQSRDGAAGDMARVGALVAQVVSGARAARRKASQKREAAKARGDCAKQWPAIRDARASGIRRLVVARAVSFIARGSHSAAVLTSSSTGRGDVRAAEPHRRDAQERQASPAQCRCIRLPCQCVALVGKTCACDSRRSHLFFFSLCMVGRATLAGPCPEVVQFDGAGGTSGRRS